MKISFFFFALLTLTGLYLFLDPQPEKARVEVVEFNSPLSVIDDETEKNFFSAHDVNIDTHYRYLLKGKGNFEHFSALKEHSIKNIVFESSEKSNGKENYFHVYCDEIDEEIFDLIK